ncbi:SPFH domain-containing protein [Aeoliella sp. ICT_H6.2]|uniref:SPFH domain-containing protein n=1 Tax=Aeoliella straminimaris TaxID=2954799 RepID=A0A9X2JJ20_9BACT|nr:SPFH domain-containing protein [Aeoliella straminimaris]MCO6046303.1 SPFH domain-containing protein [Aeoliella straminimaris]
MSLVGAVQTSVLLAVGEGAHWLAWFNPWYLSILPVPLFVLLFLWLTVRYIPNDRVGIVEKLWSSKGYVDEGRIIAMHGEAGYQARLLRGGIHWGYWRWQYAVHKVRLVTVSEGKIAYVYARDGQPLPSSQTLGRVVECNDYQDATAFLTGEIRGQRGRQRAILREGVYAINLAVFTVITESKVQTLDHLLDRNEMAAIHGWRDALADVNGFRPVVIGRGVQFVVEGEEGECQEVDSIGIVTVHDGPSLPPGEIIAPAVGTTATDSHYHNNYQDPEAFLAAGGRRGRQYVPLTDGTYFINRWFASVELIAKTVVPIGSVGVVVSYYGREGQDVTGAGFRHGERVGEGERGVRERPLGPGKYAFNTSAGSIVLVPTTNFVLHWITGKTETHRYDESLKSIDLVTKDAYEPLLPLSVVVHIDYQRAPGVIQRFGDVKKLITQTLDPMLSAFFRDIAHTKTMLELLHDRQSIQEEARLKLRDKFHEFDIECVDVLIGKPDPREGDDKIETLLEQLRLRQLSVEQIDTFAQQRVAAEKRRVLYEAEALADMQTEITNSRSRVQVAESQGDADLALARKKAEQTLVVADADLARSRREAEQTVVVAEAHSKRDQLAGQGRAQRVAQVGLAEASVLLKRIGSFGDPRLYALTQAAEHLSHSAQPLVPDRLFVTGGGAEPATGGNPAGGLLGTLVELLVAERSGFELSGNASDLKDLESYAEKLVSEIPAESKA